VNGSTTMATVTGLTNGTAYTFTVTATNAAGTGPASAASNSVTPTSPATVPGAPTGVMAWPGNAQANVSWTPPTSNGGSPITGYTVTASPGGQTGSVGSNATNAIVSGLTNGTPYTFMVAATNSAGTGPASAPSNSVTPSVGGTVAADSFNRTVSNGWGTADIGGVWDLSGAAYSVSPGAATITNAGGLDLGGELTSVSVRDAEFLVKFQLTPVADANSYSAAVRVRWSSGPNYYLIKLNYNSSYLPNWEWRTYNNIGGTFTNLVNTDGGFAPALGVANTVWMRVRVTGSNPTQVQARAWNDGSPEPGAWVLSFSDSTAGLQSAGAVGLHSWTTTASSVTYNSFQVTNVGP
jgi:hypothetical protein